MDDEDDDDDDDDIDGIYSAPALLRPACWPAALLLHIAFRQGGSRIYVVAVASSGLR